MDTVWEHGETAQFLSPRRNLTSPGESISLDVLRWMPTLKSGGLSLRILTVNAHKGFNLFNRRYILGELREAVRSVAADLVFLQEVLGAHETLSLLHASDAAPLAPQYEYLADSMWRDYAYGRNAVYPEGHHGNALLSRFPILHHANHDVSIAGNERRGLLHCLLNLPRQQRHIHAICVHLGLREVHRRQQLMLLCELVHSLPRSEAVIVAGDFNDWRLRARSVLQSCGLREVFQHRFGLPARSFPAWLPLLRLDRIYVRNVHSSQPVPMPSRPWSRLSDHAPLAAEVWL